jgi:Gly-Xaa carboxypeptidase
LLWSGSLKLFFPFAQEIHDLLAALDEVKAHDTALLTSLGKEFNLTYNAFGSRISEEGAPATGSLTLSDAYNGDLEPAPITPTGKDDAPYQLLSGTIRATYNVYRSLSDEDESIIVAPSVMTGNTGILSYSSLLCPVFLTEHCCTDTRFYWKLSQHIFRYNHYNAGDSTNSLGKIHTVNECQFSCNRHFCYNADTVKLF